MKNSPSAVKRLASFFRCAVVFSLAPVDGFWGAGGFGMAVGVYAGLVLSAVVVCLGLLISLSLLATARGGASFLCPKRQRNEAKKTL